MNLLQAVCLGSRSGKYGGPFDTSCRQLDLMAVQANVKGSILYGYISGDEPDGPGPNTREFTAPLHRWFPSPGFTGLFSLGFGVQSWRAVKWADVVHLSFARELTPLWVALVCYLQGTPWIAQTHGMLTTRTSLVHRVADRFALLLLNRARFIVALTSTEKGDLERRFGEKLTTEIVVLGNPVPPSPETGKRVTHAPNVSWIARLHERKRVHDFVDAADVARSQGWQEIYRVIGPDGGQLSSLEERLALGVSNVVYEGAVAQHQIAATLLSSDCFVLCSDKEPWGNVVVQALALGVPVVITESCALSISLRRANAAIVVPDGDAELLAIAIHSLASGPNDERSMLIRRGRMYVESELADGPLCTKLLDLYRRSI